MSLPKAFLDEIRARVPLSEVINKRMKLTRAGREYKGCCPFHKEKTPSFTVNNEKGFYHCFGCGAHGDNINFLMAHDNLGFMEAVEQLAALAGMQVPKPTPEEAKKFKRQMSLYDLMETTTKYYEQQLHSPKNKKVLQYLMERGLSLETISSFRVGFAPPEGDELATVLKRAGFKEEDMIDAGMFRQSDRRKGEIYAFFRNRVMFPVADFQGRVMAFGGRVLPGTDKKAPKYVNSPESPIFHKGNNLYGLSRARKAIGEGEMVLVVEGYMDVIALAQAGYRAAVAPLGTALTESQVLALWKVMPEGGKNPVLCFDGDSAGQRAAVRSLDRMLPILRPDHTARFAFLPAEHDPDSLIKAEGRAAMDKVLNNAVSLFEMMWQDEAGSRDLSQPEVRAGFRTALIKRARHIEDVSLQEFFIHDINQKVKDKFLTIESGKSGHFFKKRQEPGVHTPYRPSGKKVSPLRSKKFLRERVLIGAMVNHPELYNDFSEEFGLFQVHSFDFDQLRQTLIMLLDEENTLDYQALKTHLINSGHGEILDAVFDQSLYLYAGFLKPKEPYEVVRQGWQDTYNRGLIKARQKEA